MFTAISFAFRRVEDKSHSAFTLFTRRAGLDRHGMHPFTRQIAQRLVDHALPLEAGYAFKSGALDHHGEVRFPAAIIAHMAAMAGAVVDNFQPFRGKGLGQKLGDFLLNADFLHGHQVRGKPQCRQGQSSTYIDSFMQSYPISHAQAH